MHTKGIGWAVVVLAVSGAPVAFAKCDFLLVPGGDVVLTMSEHDVCRTGPLPMWEGSGGVLPNTKTDRIEIVERAADGHAFTYDDGRSFGYQPAPGFVGRDRFRIRGSGRTSDGRSLSFIGTVTVSVQP